MKFLHNVSNENKLRENKIFLIKEVLSLCTIDVSGFKEFQILYSKNNTNKGFQFVKALIDKINTIKSNRQLNEWIRGFNKSL